MSQESKSGHDTPPEPPVSQPGHTSAPSGNAASDTGLSKAAKKRNRKKNKAAKNQTPSSDSQEPEASSEPAEANEPQVPAVLAAEPTENEPETVAEPAVPIATADVPAPVEPVAAEPVAVETKRDSVATSASFDEGDFEDSSEQFTAQDKGAEDALLPGGPVPEHAGPAANAAPSLPPRKFIPMALDSAPTGNEQAGVDASSLAPSLLQARSAEISVTFDSKDPSQQTAINTGVESIKKTFREIKNTIGHMPAGLLGGEEIQWEFWSRVVDNYYDVVQSESSELQQAIAGGVPKEIRGIIWQLISRSKDPQLEELYMHLKTEASVHERAIKRDLTRTSFYTNVEAVDKATELFNVISAYSNFDPDVGYTQGMAFIAIPLVMNMTESECFCLLVALMKEYGLRDLFCPDMHGLHLLLHQFDRLLELHSPLLYNHLVRQGIKSSMYASQWFLTFFGYKFPLEVVLRIFDMIITQGMEVVLKLALNLMLRNERTLLRLSFDSLLDYLKSNLFNVYVKDEFVKQESQETKRFSLLARKPSLKSSDYYNLDLFIQDSLSLDVSPLDLKRYKVEFDQIVSKDSDRVAEIEQFRDENGKLRHEIKLLEMELYSLNQNHMNLVESLVNLKVNLPELTADNEELEERVAGLENDIQDLESKLGLGNTDIPQDIEAQIGELLQQNATETERFASLEEELGELTIEHDNLRAELNSKKWFWKK